MRKILLALTSTLALLIPSFAANAGVYLRIQGVEDLVPVSKTVCGDTDELSFTVFVSKRSYGKLIELNLHFPQGMTRGEADSARWSILNSISRHKRRDFILYVYDSSKVGGSTHYVVTHMRESKRGDVFLKKSVQEMGQDSSSSSSRG